MGIESNPEDNEVVRDALFEEQACNVIRDHYAQLKHHAAFYMETPEETPLRWNGIGRIYRTNISEELIINFGTGEIITMHYSRLRLAREDEAWQIQLLKRGVDDKEYPHTILHMNDQNRIVGLQNQTCRYDGHDELSVATVGDVTNVLEKLQIALHTLPDKQQSFLERYAQTNL
jgi:hypothetical protein